MSASRAGLAEGRRWVIKVGSSLVTAKGAGLDLTAIADWCAQIAQLRQAGVQVVLVSSGAVAEGMARLGLKKRPAVLHELQAAAAVGQMGLVRAYEEGLRIDRRRSEYVMRIAGIHEKNGDDFLALLALETAVKAGQKLTERRRVDVRPDRSGCLALGHGGGLEALLGGDADGLGLGVLGEAFQMPFLGHLGDAHHLLVRLDDDDAGVVGDRRRAQAEAELAAEREALRRLEERLRRDVADMIEVLRADVPVFFKRAVKAVFEERWMVQAHPGYAAYRQRTRRFLPWLF